MPCVQVPEADGDLSKFDIPEALKERLRQKGVTKLFPVQYMSFDSICSGSDAVVLARTGTGKTLAFSIPIIKNLMQATEVKRRGRYPSVLVLAPTRELVSQIASDFESLCATDITVLSVYGGVPLGPQCSSLRLGVDVLIGTTGRVIDLMERNALKLSALRYVVLDEVDRMLDMGFSKDVNTILSSLYEGNESKTKPQTLLFSATMPSWVSSVAQNYLSKDAVHISLIQEQENRTSTNVTHLALPCPYAERASTIADVIRAYCPRKQSRSIVFCERKKDADELASHASMNTDCHVFHGDIPQDKRELILQRFREGKYRTLITTNVAARGLDIPEVDLVIQCHPPKDVEDYIHRSGRTGRADRSGTSIVFYTQQERNILTLIERKAEIQFRRIAPPTLQDILDAWTRETAGSFLTIPEATWSAFIPTAKSLVRLVRSGKPLDEDEVQKDNSYLQLKAHKSKSSDSQTKVKPMMRVLCCALARLSGKDGNMESRSLLSSRTGMTTYKLDLPQEASRKGEAYNTLRQQISEDIVNQLKNLTFIKNRHGFVFDIPSELDADVASQWKNSASEAKLQVLRELPELEVEFVDHDFEPRSNGWRGGSSYRGFSGGGRGYGRGNNRGGGRGFGAHNMNGSNGLSFKRPFSAIQQYDSYPDRRSHSFQNGIGGDSGKRGKRTTFDE